MKVTVNFGPVRVIVPCGNGDLLVRDLVDLAITRYKKASGKVSAKLRCGNVTEIPRFSSQLCALSDSCHEFDTFSFFFSFFFPSGLVVVSLLGKARTAARHKWAVAPTLEGCALEMWPVFARKQSALGNVSVGVIRA